MFESKSQSEARHIAEFDSLRQGTMPHPEFRQHLCKLLEKLRAHDINEAFDENALYRKYLARIRPQSRGFCDTTMARFPEGDDEALGHACYATTWEEVSHQC